MSTQKLDTISKSFVQIEVDRHFPIQNIEFQNFVPVYDIYETVKPLKFSKIKQKYNFTLLVSEPKFFHLVDENNLGICDLFLHPNDTLKLKLLFDGHFVKKQILEADYPGDNVLYQNIYDSILQMDNIISTITDQKFSINNTDKKIDSLFDIIINPAIQKNKGLITSDVFMKNVFDLQLAHLKTYFKNKLNQNNLSNSIKHFCEDSLYIKPNYKFWSRTYFGADKFREYIYKCTNNYKIGSLKNFVSNALKFYESLKDTALNKIIVSSSIKVFFEKKGYNLNDDLSNEVDSLCTKYNLQTKYFPTHNLFLKETNILKPLMLNTLQFRESLSTNITFLSTLITDTSSIYYIDFWASWCRPCINSLPNTNALFKKEIENLHILYISIDKNFKSFTEAEKKYHIPINNSFVIENENSNNELFESFKKSDFIPDYKILIYKSGNWYLLNSFEANDPNLIKQINFFNGKKH